MNLPVEDVIELEQLCAAYALKMTQGDIGYIIEHICTDDGTYSAFGETYGLEDWPRLVEAAPKGLFLTGRPVLELDGDTGSGEVPLLFIDQTNHHMRMGWYSDTYRRTENGWRLRTRRMTFLRRNGGADSGKPHDPRRPKPSAGRPG
ncbi:nuclear transport factor 2 family protein [Actinocorallia populi]|uniref:nuclear transport factor 2 family protein n=1 Tax=Actinocorallia populi TaxID=2079200 RepID=UPI0018E504C4|nr:nuclear transport factor 2 family protein [Actinocorallia populi]